MTKLHPRDLEALGDRGGAVQNHVILYGTVMYSVSRVDVIHRATRYEVHV